MFGLRTGNSRLFNVSFRSGGSWWEWSGPEPANCKPSICFNEAYKTFREARVALGTLQLCAQILGFGFYFRFLLHVHLNILSNQKTCFP